LLTDRGPSYGRIVAEVSDGIAAPARQSRVRVVDGTAGRLRHPARERLGQLAAWVDVAEEDVGQGVALLLAAIPALQHCRNLVEPGHRDRAAASHHHDRAGIGSSNCLDEQILFIRERDARPIGVFAPVVSHDDDRHIRLPGERCGLLLAAIVTKIEISR